MRSFKSNENIHKKESGSYYVISANKTSSVTLQSPGNKSQRKHTSKHLCPNSPLLSSHFITSHLSSQSLNLGGHRGTTDDVAIISFHPFLSSAALRESPKLRSHPFLDVIFPSLLLSSSPSCSFHSPLQNCLRHARGS